MCERVVCERVVCERGVCERGVCEGVGVHGAGGGGGADADGSAKPKTRTPHKDVRKKASMMYYTYIYVRKQTNTYMHISTRMLCYVETGNCDVL